VNGESWVPAADRAIAMACAEVKLIRAVTPENADQEIARLEQSFERGVPAMPAFRYEPCELRAELPLALERLTEFLHGISPLARIYADRARELWLESLLIHAVGSPKLSVLSRQRFLGQTEEDIRDHQAADELAHAWSRLWVEDARADETDLVESCDTSDPASLFCAMSREVGRLRLAMRIVVQPGLASLAATADGALLIAKGRRIRRLDVARTVLHEIEGHALPRRRAASLPIGIFTFGTARGIDDQEGRALLLERESGFLDPVRKKELGMRHLAARAALGGADLVEVVALLRSLGANVRSAVRIAARVARGATGEGGLAREIVYLPALVRVGRAQKSELGALVESVMARGRVAAHVAPSLAAFTPEAAWQSLFADTTSQGAVP
jgi:hypothetical protein